MGIFESKNSSITESFEYEIYKDENNRYHRFEIDRFGNEIYKDENNRYHREDGPAIIYNNGSKEQWYKHGLLHKEDGPAVIDKDGTKKWYLNGIEYSKKEFEKEICIELKYPRTDPLGNQVWRNKKGKYHREDGPAVIDKDGTKKWYLNGIRHNLNGPAVIYNDGFKEYWIDGEEFTKEQFEEIINVDPEEKSEIDYDMDGLPIEKPDGTKKWYFDGTELTEEEFYNTPKIDEDGTKRWYNKKGQLHRENDLPAVEMENGYKAWYKNGKRHRLKGYAVIYSDGSGKWYINGIEKSEEIITMFERLPYSKKEAVEEMKNELYFRNRIKS